MRRSHPFDDTVSFDSVPSAGSLLTGAVFLGAVPVVLWAGANPALAATGFVLATLLMACLFVLSTLARQVGRGRRSVCVPGTELCLGT